MEKIWRCLVVLLAMATILPLQVVGASQKPVELTELAHYRGADRQQVLIEGAKKEGRLTFYTSGTYSTRMIDAFEKKYPFVKVERWRADSKNVTNRVIEERRSGKSGPDVIEMNPMYHLILQKAGLYQSFYSSSFSGLEEEALTRAADGGAIWAAFRLGGIGLGFNTKLIAREEVPKSYAELLDPKWKGKMAIVGSSTGVSWSGVILETYGEDFLKKMASQDITVHMVSGRALNDMIINGEYAFSPTIFSSHVYVSRNKGAPLDWIPLEPVFTNVGQIALSNHALHPHAALLLIDFALSKEAAEIYMKGGYSTFNKDTAGVIKYKIFEREESMENLKKWNGYFNKYFLKK